MIGKNLLFGRSRADGGRADAEKMAEYEARINAINRSQAVIEFDLDGTIRHANENFLGAMGYTLDEVAGKHHRMFVPTDYAASSEYREHWESLRRGEFASGEFRRLGKDGKDVWIQATYNPIFDSNGNPMRVVKYASDITQQKLLNADFRGQIDAISKSQAVIEFNMDGTIITANENFLSAMGYSLDDIRGRHHSMFAEPEYAASEDYKAFWRQLNRGEYDAAEYRRLGKNGKEVWIQATYNPIMDTEGRPIKVVKYATDITAQKKLAQTLDRVLGETSKVLSGVAEGVLTRRIDGEFPDKFVGLKEATNSTIAKLFSVVSNIMETSNRVRTGATEISQGNSSLSARTEQQATSLEETASSMEEMTSTVKQNADNAGEANQLAMAARTEAEKGGEVVGQAITAMHAIADSSKKIADIIGVIDEIAFQTNLLALNASVEAARAGDQGRGFAVVASEVRNLAGRSAKAAKEIKDLIQDSGRKVDEGAKLVNESGDSLDSIVNGVKKVTDIVGEIAAASQEQSTGIEEVSNAIIQLDELTQQNAALVEEAAAASEAMGEQAENLSEVVSFFTVGDVQKAVSSPARNLERRSESRPWSAPAAEQSKPLPQRQSVANGSDQEWEEF